MPSQPLPTSRRATGSGAARLRALVAALLVAAPSAAAAQEGAPTAPPDAWTGSLGAGLALTSGNSETRSYNVSFAVAHDPRRKNVFKAEGLYLRADQAGAATADKTSLGARDEYKLSRRAFVFGEVRYLRDRFKEITYLVSPVAGAGYRLVDAEGLTLAVDGALGGAHEKLHGRAASTSVALQAGEALTWKLSPSATLTQSVTALWKTEDFGDGTYRLAAGITTTSSGRLELKVGYTKDIQTRLPDPGLKKSDDSLLAALALKF